MIRIRQKGDFSRAIRYMKNAQSATSRIDLDKYGREGVAALASATPVDTGRTANSWEYRVTRDGGSFKLSFINTNIQNGVPIAIILQYGHGTRNGCWVQGIDYINPSLQPVLDRLANDIWREVTKS